MFLSTRLWKEAPLSLRMMHKYKHLFTPLVLGDTLFRNRIFAAPLGLEYYPAENLHPGDDFIAFYERKAQGGAATVSIGSAMVDNARGAIGPTIRLDDPSALAPHYRLAQCISRHGAVADIELQHAGANAYHSKLGLGNEIYGAFDSINGLGMEVPAMPEEVILETIEKYGDAAQTARHCGYGMVTVHAGHGWLLHQFLSPQNNRKDRWGGSMENRARIVVAIAANIKKKCGPGFPICIRISGAEIYAGGYDIDYGVEIARQLDGHYDLINVSVGVHEAPEVFTHTHPSMFLEDGANVQYAAAIKKAVRHSKVAAVGALAEPALMEEIIAAGEADVVMLCRQLLADPDTPLKAQAGREQEIRKCMRCFECFSGQFMKLSTYCAINPEIGFERETRYAAPVVRHKRRVLIAGGGVAGMQAAITAAERGHTVILCEKNEYLGGILRCEAKVPFKQNLQKYLDQQAAFIRKSNMTLHLKTAVTPALAKDIQPDVIIAACGSRPLVPKIPGIDGPNVLSAEHAFMHPELVGERVLIIGGGLSGLELAIYLSMLGRKVSVMEMSGSLNYSGNIIHGMAINNAIKHHQIEIITSTKAVAIDERGVTGEFVGDKFSPPPLCGTIAKGILTSAISEARLERDEAPGSRIHYEADTVIYALGQVPLREEAHALSDCAPLFFSIGDCVEPKNIYTANAIAYTIARDLGRY